MTPAAEVILGAFTLWGVPLEIYSRAARVRSRAGAGVTGGITHSAPAHWGGIRWPARTVVWSSEELKKPEQLCGLVHELAHVLLGVNPSNSDEVHSEMLALEAAHHAYLGLTQDVIDNWFTAFNINDKGTTWFQASWSQRLDVMHSSRRCALRKGLINAEGYPTFHRHKKKPEPAPTVFVRRPKKEKLYAY